ncbi:MAG TPA: signal peptidase I [Micavibrio sp.]
MKTPEPINPETADQPAPLNAREEWTEFMKTALIAVVLAMLIRTFLYEPFNIPSSSMKPTLEIGDYLFVSKPAYGFSKHSFPLGLGLFEGRVMADGKVPQRGDVVVFYNDKTGQDYIKRVIGLPGDRVQVNDGQLYLNRQKVPREIIGLKKVREGDFEQVLTEYTQTLPEGAMFSIYEESDSRPLDNTEEFLVPAGHYFMMGDNRDNSQDSRVQSAVGFVPYDNLIGRASFIFFSTDGSAGLAEVWKWPFAIRYGRIFDSIDPVRPPQTPASEKTTQGLTRDAHAAAP